ncbi:MAG TPA: sodium:solute symporter, partial [Bryobacteraceae bacterium]|nr:sodium:solute symporter [Bryobacteraceae bacterium]
FVQYYLGLPIAMVILCATVVPIYHRSGVYTAYEYLEKRFDAKTRALVSTIFLIQRGLGVGVALSAPAIVLSVILGWPERYTTLAMGALVIAYTVAGGIKAVTWTDVQQMVIIFIGIITALITAIWLLPGTMSLMDAMSLAGAAGKLNAIDTRFDLKTEFNIWSGIIGGLFLALAYFGTDQSQVQRYLTGKSITASRLSLLFNAMAKVPMQFLILFTGAIVFVFYIYERPPLIFHHVELEKIQRAAPAEYGAVEGRFNAAFEARKNAASRVLQAERAGDDAAYKRALNDYRVAQKSLDGARREGFALAKTTGGDPKLNDTNHIFLSFVTRYMPAGLVGLVLAAIFAAAMSTISAEINSLATVSVIDVYRRHIRKTAPDRHYLWASRVFTAFWGCYAIWFAQYGAGLGSLVVAVNKVGSLFYGSMLGAFVLAFGFPHTRGTAAFIGVLAGQAAIIWGNLTLDISFLWYNVLGCVVAVGTGLIVSALSPQPRVDTP